MLPLPYTLRSDTCIEYKQHLTSKNSCTV